MARAAFVMDRIMRFVGASWKIIYTYARRIWMQYPGNHGNKDA